MSSATGATSAASAVLSPATTAPIQSVEALRQAGRTPALPLSVRLQDGRTLRLRSLLRVLPGKRLVGEAELEDQRVLAKLFIASASARHWQRELQGIEALLGAGIPTPALMHAGELEGGGHVLLTRFVDDAVSLATRWEAVAHLPAGHVDALAVLTPAFAMLGRLHAQGLVQDDLHLGNFLVSGGDLLVIDGDAVRALSPGHPLGASAALTNLAILAAQLPAAWDEHQTPLVDAWHAGGAGLPVLEPAPLRASIVRTRDARLEAFLAKTTRDCTLFKVDKHLQRMTIVVRDKAEELAALLADPDAAIAGGTLLKEGSTCTVARVVAGGEALVIKRYNIKSAQHALSRAWRPSRAAHSWLAGHRLAFLGIATPAPRALIEARLGPLRHRAWIINTHCPGRDLAEHLAAYVHDGPPAAEGEALRSLFATLHRERISHGDLKASNLLWHDGQVVLIDLDAMQQHRNAASHARAWRRDRARLLRNWPVDSGLWRWLDAELPPA